MEKISQDAITALLQSEAHPAVTLYIPMEQGAAPQHISQNQIRFKNMIHRAGTELAEKEADAKLSKELATLLEDNYENMEFWKSQSRGLLIAASPDSVQLFKLPVDTEEYIAIDDTFHLAPILSLLSDNREYYVLALAQQHPILYKGDMYDMERVDIGLPATMRAGLGIDEANQQSENQGSATGSSLNTGWFNGRGGARDPQDNDRIRLWHLIDKLLYEKADRSIPLVLAGTDSENAEYRGISKYPLILKGALTGNHTEANTEDLHAKAWPIVHHELVAPEHAAALEEYERLAGANPDRVARSTEAITEAADQGRVDKLLTMMSRNTTDTVQDGYAASYRISFPEGDHGKLVNKLASKVWQMSGKIVSLLPNEMPQGAPMVARLRY
jgi:hypothetical protein